MKFILILVLMFSSVTSWASSIDGVKIEKISIKSSYGNYVFVKLATAPERATCSTNGGWDYTLSLETETYKSMYSMLLAAYMSGNKVNIHGFTTPTCNEFPHIESIDGIYLVK